MVESMLGVLLMAIAAAAGYVCGRNGRRIKRERPMPAAFGWQELLNFLQYDGSGQPPKGHTERGRTDEK